MAVDEELATNLIQAVNRGIAGVRKAPDLASYPTAIDTSDLPYVLTWLGPGQWYIKGGGYKVDKRTMLLICYIQPLGQNDIPSRAVQAVRLHQTMRATYITASTVPLADPDTNSGYQITVTSGEGTPHSDTGLRSDLQFGGKAYHGFILQVNINILWSV
jgi:hypothetical protein